MMDMFDNLEGMLPLCEMASVNVEAAAGSLDPSHYKAYARNPNDIDRDTLVDLADMVDRAHDARNVIAAQQAAGREPMATPRTIDQLMNSIMVVYVTCDGAPVAVTNVVDPSVEDYHGYVPLKFYSMKTGYDLDGRLQQSFFSIDEDYRDTGVARELLLQLNANASPCFVVVDPTDAPTVRNVQEGGYMNVGKLTVDGTGNEMELWVSPAKERVPSNEQDQ
jgi:hypothetical protein